jgi:hypothetical protein
MVRALPAISFFLGLSLAGISFAADAPRPAPDSSAGDFRSEKNKPSESTTRSRRIEQEVDPTDVSPSPTPSPKPAVSPGRKEGNKAQEDPNETPGQASRQSGRGFETVSTNRRLLPLSKLMALRDPPPQIEVDPSKVLSANFLGQGFEANTINEGATSSCVPGEMPFPLLRSILTDLMPMRR